MSLKLSVLLPVYNCSQTVRRTIDSILSQTFRDFELLVLNDGSTDSTLSIIHEFKDSRIMIIDNAENLGISATLSKAFPLCRGDFIARMDADDIALPMRFEKQLEYMSTHPEIAICGCSIKTFYDGLSLTRNIRYPDNPDQCKSDLFFNTPLAHPSVIIRREQFLLHGLNYDPSVSYPEDYDLWQRASGVLHIANIPEVLLRYHIRNDSVERKAKENRGKWKASFAKIYKRIYEQCDLPEELRDASLHFDIEFRKIASVADARKAKKWLWELIRWNNKTHYYLPSRFAITISNKWLKLALGRHFPTFAFDIRIIPIAAHFVMGKIT